MLTANEVMSVKVLAERVGVSKRTIQRELEYIGKSLKPYHVTFESKTGVGVWIEGEEEDKKSLLEEIDSEDRYDVANREERRKRLTLELLREKGLKKLFVYSSKFKVSEATISGDLEVVEKWLNKYEIKIVRKPGSGIYVEGSEANYRRAIRAFLQENINTKLMQEVYEMPFAETRCLEVIKKSGIGQMLQEDIMQRVVDCVTALKNPHILSLTESSYMGLILHISIAINRMLQEELIENDTKWLEEFEEDADYELAEDIVWSLEEEFDIEIPEMEISYICLHIKGAKHEHVYYEGKRKLELDNQEIKKLLSDMIYAFDTEKAYLLRRDEEFIQGILAHLQPTLIRLSHGLEIHNPILEGIQKDYADIYKKCERVAKVIEEWNGKCVPEAEIGFLAVHFGAALVRAEGKLENIRPVSVAVVCSSGIGISRLMLTKLESIFHERVIMKTYGKRDMTPYEQKKYDFCITSITIEKLDIPVIDVNPLLTEDDIERIRRMVDKYERTPQKNKEVAGYIDQMEEVQLVATQINYIIKYMRLYREKKDVTFEMLLKNIGMVLSPYEDQQALIRKSIEEREKVASQVYAEFDFALLHARTEGVQNPMFHICLTEDGTSYDNPYFKNITVVFIMLVPVDDNLQRNTEILGYISEMLVEDSSFLDVVREGEEEKCREKLSKQLKKYFANHVIKLTEE